MWDKLMTDTNMAKFLAKKLNSPKAGLLLLKFMYHTDSSNLVAGVPVDIAKKFGISLRNFTYGVRELKGLDLVRKYSKREYMLNPAVSYHGDTKRAFILQHIWDTQTTSGLRE